MAAVTGNLEQREHGPEVQGGVSGGPLGGLRSGPSKLASSHQQLTGTHWVRSAIEWYARQLRFRHEWSEGRLVIRIVKSPAKFEGRPVVPVQAVPWAAGGSPVHTVEVWSLSNSKMDCPVFDLPAGAISVGGTCPGAEMGQTVVPPNIRAARAKGGIVYPDGRSVQLQEERTICQHCYAEGGSFRYADNQARMTIRYWWVRAMLEAMGVEETAQLITASIQTLPFPPGAPGGILPIRLHSSGDFFTRDYALMWLQVARNLWEQGGSAQLVRFWAPTRTWAGSPGWQRFWAEQLPTLPGPNFMVRASAYHFDDPAPGPLAPGNAQGSTSLFRTSDPGLATEQARVAATFFAPRGETRYRWRCPTYSASEDENKSCSDSPNPHGGRHCRACWVEPKMSINYPAH